MLGAITGDIIGSRFEWHNIKRKDFELFDKNCAFTDDSVLTVATAEALLTGRDYAKVYRMYFELYPHKGYGGNFLQWGAGHIKEPYNSYGNGSAMRVSPVAWVFDSLDEVLAEAERSAEVTHNHPEGIKGAQSTAEAIFLARKGYDQSEIRKRISDDFGYDLSFTLDEIRPSYDFDVTCQGSVPQAIVAFLESTGFEDAIRNAISIGGDSDTIAAITGSIAEAYYNGVPEGIRAAVNSFLPERFEKIISEFQSKHME